MAPVRRYLRISAYSVLETRIYLDNPADAQRWLLRPSDPALPRIIAAVRPLVLPKLREERENARSGGGGGKASKKKSVKDVVQADEFDVSVFLTELGTSHSLLTRAKVFAGKGKKSDAAAARSSGTRGAPLEIADEDDDGTIPNLRREDSEEEGRRKAELQDVPMHDDEDDEDDEGNEDDEDDDRGSAIEISDSESGGGGGHRAGGRDDKKKLGFRTSYDGFRIHGRILCLVVKRKASSSGRGKQVAADSAGQAVMENWIASTQENPAMLEE